MNNNLIIGFGFYNNCVLLKYVELTGLSGSTALGGTTGNDSVFGQATTSGSIKIPSFYSSSNAGSPDGDLVAIINKGWTVTYV